MLFRNLDFFTILARLIVLLTAIPVHEAAHGWAAEKMGDRTARHSRRISLNPLAHIDPIGAIMILLLGVGFARPVPINSMRFTDRKKGIIVTSLAGPVSNILLALVSLALVKLLIVPFALVQSDLLHGALLVISYMVTINLYLAVFNLLPIPPLDGWHALSQVLPGDIYWKIAPYEGQMIWLVILLAMTGWLGRILSPVVGLLYLVIDKMTFFLDLLPAVIR